MNYLINKAKEKGIYIPDWIMESGLTIGTRDIFIMSLIQKKLRDEHDIDVEVSREHYTGDYGATIFHGPDPFDRKETFVCHDKTSYERALEEALIKSLTLIE